MDTIKKFFQKNWLLTFAIIYLILPADLIPDIIPILGKADDTSILLFDLIRRYIEFKKTDEKI